IATMPAVGTLGFGNSGVVDGALDDVFIWNRAISDAEVTQEHTFTTLDHGLVAHITFDDFTFADVSNQGHDGVNPVSASIADVGSGLFAGVELGASGSFHLDGIQASGLGLDSFTIAVLADVDSTQAHQSWISGGLAVAGQGFELVADNGVVHCR